MIASARAAQVAPTSARLGIHVGQVRVDLATIVDRKNRIVQRWCDSIAQRLRATGERLRLVRGQARLVAEHEVDVGAEQHRAGIIVVNAGAPPSLPPLRIDAVPWLDNTRALERRNVPFHLLILGGGYIACELGQMFRRFGAGGYDPRLS